MIQIVSILALLILFVQTIFLLLLNPNDFKSTIVILLLVNLSVLGFLFLSKVLAGSTKNNQKDDSQNNLDQMKKEIIQKTRISLVGEFSSGIAHDINNPLSIIIMHADRFEKHSKEFLAENEKANKSFEKIKTAAERIQMMTAKLGKIRNKETDYRNDTNLKEVIERSIFDLSYQIIPQNIEIKNTITEKLECYGDRNSLEQLFSNIISNSCDAMKNSTEKVLTISTEQAAEESQFVVNVTDTGHGIPEKDKEEIFTRFFTTKDDGVGLGLSSAMRIIKDHCGEVEVLSPKNGGTTLKITLNKKL